MILTTITITAIRPASLSSQVRHISLILVSLLFFAFPSVGMTQAPDGEPVSYSFGVVPQYAQRQMFRNWRPVLDAIEQRIGIRLELKGTPKIPVFEKQFMDGEFDFAYMNPYHVLKAAENQGYIPLVRDGKRKLKGILVVHKDNPIENLRELRGKEVVFPSPNALGASLLMRSDLEQRYQVQIRPRYVQTHSSVYLHVVKQLAVAGGGVQRTLDAQPAAIRDKLRILYTTRGMPPHPVTAHPRVPEAIRNAVQRALLEMGTDPKLKTLLAKIPLNEIVTTNINEYKVMRAWNLDRYYVSN
jgi:phosphonate transport system substrate-binding protein